MDYLSLLDDKEKELDIKNNPNELKFFKGIKETSIFTNSVKESFKNNYDDKIYINTENNIFSVKNEKNPKYLRKIKKKIYLLLKRNKMLKLLKISLIK